ncbi:MAG: SH3 domain-containing protein [Lachnospiraceae bacterium]|nr:SH3 domain-containing protein [Lachnospiraceae bacterium]
MHLKNMKDYTICVLLSLLHVCVFCIGVFIFTAPDSTQDMMPAVEHEDGTKAASETKINPEANTEMETVSHEENIMASEEASVPQTETASEDETAETVVSYTFQYSGGKRNLNIRKGPSTNNEIIGKIPPNGSGSVLEFVNDEWALIEYRGMTGYCNRKWMVLMVD